MLDSVVEEQTSQLKSQSENQSLLNETQSSLPAAFPNRTYTIICIDFIWKNRQISSYTDIALIFVFLLWYEEMWALWEFLVFEILWYLKFVIRLHRFIVKSPHLCTILYSLQVFLSLFVL